MDAESADDEEPVHSRDIPREDVTSLDTSYQAEGSARPQNASEIPGTSITRVAQLFLNDRCLLKRVDIYPPISDPHTRTLMVLPRISNCVGRSKVSSTGTYQVYWDYIH